MKKNKNSNALQTAASVPVGAWKPTFESDDDALEAKLAWPMGSLGWLRAAFQGGARRQVSWDLRGLLPEAIHAAAQAASVFRRGVETIPGSLAGAKPPYRPLVLQGCHSVQTMLDAISVEFSGPEAHLFLVVDETVAKTWPAIGVLLEKIPFWIFKGGEPAKNLRSVAELIQQVRMHLKAKKGAQLENLTIAAIGGGVTLDLAGFAAGLLGCRHINIPTTLLAMGDASVGGKTGVNFEPWGKNQIGRFHFPERVVVCPEFLQTLSVEEVRSGGAECLKHALLAEDFGLLEQWSDFLRKYSPTTVADFKNSTVATALTKMAQMKEDFVREDPFEVGSKRELLNLGHTVGHALEAVSWDRNHSSGLRHGSAVAVGLMCKVQLMVGAQPEAAEAGRRITQCLISSGCLDEFRHWYDGAGFESGELWSLMLPYLRQDKKMRSAAPASCRIVGLQWNSLSGKVTAVSLDVESEPLEAAFKKSLLS